MAPWPPVGALFRLYGPQLVCLRSLSVSPRSPDVWLLYRPSSAKGVHGLALKLFPTPEVIRRALTSFIARLAAPITSRLWILMCSPHLHFSLFSPVYRELENVTLCISSGHKMWFRLSVQSRFLIIYCPEPCFRETSWRLVAEPSLKLFTAEGLLTFCRDYSLRRPVYITWSDFVREQCQGAQGRTRFDSLCHTRQTYYREPPGRPGLTLTTYYLEVIQLPFIAIQFGDRIHDRNRGL